MSEYTEPTRKDYLDGKCSHQEYYRSIVAECGISLENDPIMSKVIASLKSGDQHLNNIPLRTWDVIALGQRARMATVLKSRGDWLTLAGGVCIMKEAARIATIAKVEDK